MILFSPLQFFIKFICIFTYFLISSFPLFEIKENIFHHHISYTLLPSQNRLMRSIHICIIYLNESSNPFTNVALIRTNTTVSNVILQIYQFTHQLKVEKLSVYEANDFYHKIHEYFGYIKRTLPSSDYHVQKG